MKVAAIDVGTNSFHLMVGRVDVSGRVETIDKTKDMVRLGDSAFSGGVISPEAFARAAEALRGFRRVAERHGCEAIIAVATSAVREAQNGGDFVRAMRDESGIDLRVISGDDEARLIYLGARASLDLAGRRALLCDIGGGSVEVMVCDARELYFQRSLKLGVLRLLGRVTTDPISADEHARLAEHCHRVLEVVAKPMRRIGFDFVAISAGTARAVAELTGAMGRPAEAGKPRVVRFADVLTLEQRLCAVTVADRSKIPGLDPRRYDSIVSGVILVRSLLEVFHADEYVLCETALREGLIQDYALRERPGIQLVDDFPDLRRRSVIGLTRKTHVLQPHAEHVAKLALDLFRGLRPLHRLPNSDGELLEFASLLHDAGYYIASSKHHKHGQYLIENTGLAGFSAEEISVLSQVVRYHRKATPKDTHEGFRQLPEPVKRKIRLLAGMLRVADGLDRTCQKAVRRVRCRITDKEVELLLSSRFADAELELWAARRKGDLLQEVLGRKLKLVLEVDSEEDGAEADEEAGLGDEPPPSAQTPAPRLLKAAPEEAL